MPIVPKIIPLLCPIMSILYHLIDVSIVLFSFVWLLYQNIFHYYVIALLEQQYSVTVLLEFLTALLDNFDLLNGIMQFADFPAVKALCIIPDSYTYLLYSKLCQHNCRIPTDYVKAMSGALTSFNGHGLLLENGV